MNYEGNSDIDFNQVRRRFWHTPEIEAALLVHDIECTKAHVAMLGETGIVDRASVGIVMDGLETIKSELAAGKSYLTPEDIDIHAGMERHLTALVGEVASIVHIAKSRNDQIATDIRLWLRDAIRDIFTQVLAVRKLLVDLAERDFEVVMPGYTHMQPAQPILLSHWWLSNEVRFKRDFDRLMDFWPRLNVLPLGANVLAGTIEPIDRKFVARYLSFDDVMENSLDAVSDRDFLIEFGAFASLVGVHISQMSSDLLLWATQEFGFVRLQKLFLFKTQKLPFKKNPELLEVLRSRPSVFYGRLMEFICQLKALPSGYSQDLQECLPGLFDMAETLKLTLDLTFVLLQGIDIDEKRMRAVACADFTNWTNAVEYLISRGIERENAQKMVENLSAYCKTRSKYFADLALNEWQLFSPAFEADIYDYVTSEESVGVFCSFGGSSKDQVQLALTRARDALNMDEKRLPGKGMSPVVRDTQAATQTTQA